MTNITIAVIKVILLHLHSSVYFRTWWNYISYRYIKLTRFSHCLLNDQCAILVIRLSQSLLFLSWHVAKIFMPSFFGILTVLYKISNIQRKILTLWIFTEQYKNFKSPTESCDALDIYRTLWYFKSPKFWRSKYLPNYITGKVFLPTLYKWC